jgi:hypothetical protein
VEVEAPATPLANPYPLAAFGPLLAAPPAVQADPATGPVDPAAGHPGLPPPRGSGHHPEPISQAEPQGHSWTPDPAAGDRRSSHRSPQSPAKADQHHPNHGRRRREESRERVTEGEGGEEGKGLARRRPCDRAPREQRRRGRRWPHRPLPRHGRRPKNTETGRIGAGSLRPRRRPAAPDPAQPHAYPVAEVRIWPSRRRGASHGGPDAARQAPRRGEGDRGRRGGMGKRPRRRHPCGRTVPGQHAQATAR